MNDYSMPRYFQHMPVLKAPAVKPNAENMRRTKRIETEIHEQA